MTADNPESTNWGDDDPSVFLISNVGMLQGEFQLTNGYGEVKAPSVMRVSWVSYSFRFL